VGTNGKEKGEVLSIMNLLSTYISKRHQLPTVLQMNNVELGVLTKFHYYAVNY